MTELRRVWTYLLLSTVAGAMVLVIALIGYDEVGDVPESDRRVLAGAFLVVSALGIVSAVRPNWRDRLASDPEPGDDLPEGEEGRVLPGPPRRGHHPECERFASHTIQLRGRTRCAGCTGLAAGALGVIPLLWLYAAHPEALEWWEGVAMVVAGLSLVALDLGAAVVGSVNPWAGLGLNALLVLGFALVCVGLLEATGQLAWGLVGIVLSVLWMDTRIQVSRWNHSAVCAICPEGCVAYSL